jgi:hypothetical protein
VVLDVVFADVVVVEFRGRGVGLDSVGPLPQTKNPVSWRLHCLRGKL